MNKMVIAAVMAVAGLSVVAGEPKCPMEGNWTLVRNVSDEFEQGLDRAKWRDMNPDFTGRRGVFCFARKNVAVRDGELQLTARELTKEEIANDLRGFTDEKWATAVVKSRERVRYGYFESRIKAMKASVCNAFWLYDPLGGTDAKVLRNGFCEEIDIMELFGEPTTWYCKRTVFGTCHRYATPYVEGIANKYNDIPSKQAYCKQFDFDFWKDYHTFGLLWTEKELVWYIDGVKMGSRANDFFKRPLNVMVNCEVMPSWGGAPTKEQLPAVMHIDYVRVWQQAK